MSRVPNPLPFFPGAFIWCVKIHEDKLRAPKDRQGLRRKKANGDEEQFNEYVVEGKLRAALVLVARPDCRDVIVWYTHTELERKNESWIDVTDLTRPPSPKLSFLKPDGAQIRRVPHKDPWCSGLIRTLDRAVFGPLLERALKVPNMRL